MTTSTDCGMIWQLSHKFVRLRNKFPPWQTEWPCRLQKAYALNAVIKLTDSVILCSAHWSGIHGLLKLQLPAGVLKLGHTVKSFQRDSASGQLVVSIEATNTSNSEQEERTQINVQADLLVAADGSHSGVLNQLNPTAKPRCNFNRWPAAPFCI